MLGYPGRGPRRTSCWLALLCVCLAACSAKVTAPPEPPLSIEQGDEAFRYGQYETAIAAYQSYLDQYPQDVYTPRAYYKTALAEFRLGKYNETLHTLTELNQAYPQTRWVQVEALRGDAYRESGKPIVAIQAWDTAWPMGNESDQAKLRERIVLAAHGLDQAQLKAARLAVFNEDVAELLDNQIAARQRSQPGDQTGSQAVAARDQATQGSVRQGNVRSGVRATQAGLPGSAATPSISEPKPTPPAVAARASQLEPLYPAPPPPPAAAPSVQAAAPGSPPTRTLPAEAELAAAPPAPSDAQPGASAESALALAAPELPPAHVEVVAKIGCLLPLSGPERELGERSLRGIRLVFGEDRDQLVVKDSAGDTATALSQFSQLAAEPDVKVVIGPIRGEDAERIAPVAEKAQLPALLLSQRDGLGGRYAVQVGMTRSRMLTTLLDYAMGKARIYRIGVLYPTDASGKELLASVRHEVTRRGGTIVGTQPYAPQTRTLALETIQKWRDDKHVQGIFLPDTAAEAEGFARFLEREMPDVTLLGIHGWEGLAGSARDDEGEGVNGILFIDSFYVAGDRPGTRHFVDLYQRIYGEAPGTIEAQAYDAACLAKRALQAGALTRADVAQELHTVGPLDDAAGDLVATPAGIQRRLFLLRVFDGKLKEVGSS